MVLHRSPQRTATNPFANPRRGKSTTKTLFNIGKFLVLGLVLYKISALYKSSEPSPFSPEEDNTSSFSNSLSSPKKPVVVAYAVSFIKCGDFQTNAAGLIDASLILRHSIHKISSRNPSSGSKYDYKMYAIVHRDAEKCSERLKHLGFEVVVVDPPVAQNEIKGEYLKKNIHKEWCCGSDEFIKLFAYTLPHEVIVHLDIDYAFYKPMDHLFDAIIYDKDSEEGRIARDSLELERPNERNSLPDKIGAFITRDWGQVAPGKFPPAYQAGFLVARRDPKIMAEIVDVIKEGNYSSGWGLGYGWAGSGHGGYVGAMAMQGLIAYYYDHINKNNAVELNQCRHNHMGMDVKYRNNPNYTPRYVKKEYIGGCRNTLDYCEDCMVTEFDKIYSVHYTMCRKPWMCISVGSHVEGNKPRTGLETKQSLPLNVVNADHCHELNRHWHELRAEFEKELYAVTQDDTIFDGAKNDWRRDIFMGHCTTEGSDGYVTMTGKESSYHRVSEIYGD